MSDEDKPSEALRSSSRDTFVDALRSSESGFEADTELETIDRIRAVFDHSAASEAVAEVGAEVGSAAVQIPGFELREELGRGGFATVYRALDETLQREVAVKVLMRFAGGDTPTRARARESFLKEARVLASLRHENIVPIHSVIEHSGRYALVMELIEGPSLETIVEEQGVLSAAEATQIGCEIARALAAVHAGGLVHRDVKPANILRGKGGRYVLTDFGLGVFLGVRDDEGRASGTPLYMSPEQVGGAELDSRSDLYALGVVLYYLVSGEWPYAIEDGTGIRELFDAIRQGETVPLLDRRSDLPRAFLDVVEKALALDPLERHQTAGEIERDLRELSGESAAAVATSRRSFMIYGGLAAGVAVVAILAVVAESFFARGASGDLSVLRAELWSLAKGRALRDGDTVRLHEELQLEFEASGDAYVYVLNADDQNVTLLFPHPDSRHRNPLSGGRSHTLPAIQADGGGLQNWWIEERGGRERFFVVASAEPWQAFEALIDRGGVARAYPAVSFDTLLAQTRRIGLAPARAGDGRSAVELMEQLVEALDGGFSPEKGGRLWAKRIELVNP